MKSKWNEKSNADKTMLILRMFFSIAVVICAFLQLFDVWDKALNLALPLLSIVILIQSIQERKEHKISAIIGYCCFVVMVVMLLGVWFLALHSNASI